jgi:hypothetical protein
MSKFSTTTSNKMREKEERVNVVVQGDPMVNHHLQGRESKEHKADRRAEEKSKGEGINMSVSTSFYDAFFRYLHRYPYAVSGPSGPYGDEYIINICPIIAFSRLT